MLNVVMLNVVRPAIFPNVILFSMILRNVVLYSFILSKVILHFVIFSNAILVSVILLIVVAPFVQTEFKT